jgi:uncharacterized protein YhaN
MKRSILLLCVVGCVAPASAVKIGQTWDEVQAELGKPINRLEAPGRSIGRWADLEVVFVEGRVTSMVQRNLEAEAASVARRKQEAEMARRLREEVEADQRQREEAGRVQQSREQIEREYQAQVGRIAVLEKKLAEERQVLERLGSQRELVRALTPEAIVESLQKEITALRLEMRRAMTDGEKARAARLLEDVRAKEAELAVLTKGVK